MGESSDSTRHKWSDSTRHKWVKKGGRSDSNRHKWVKKDGRVSLTQKDGRSDSTRHKWVKKDGRSDSTRHKGCDSTRHKGSDSTRHKWSNSTRHKWSNSTRYKWVKKDGRSDSTRHKWVKKDGRYHHYWTKTMASRKNLLTTCHEDWAKNKTAPPLGGHVFSLIKSIFKLNQDIKKTNILTKPPPGGHVFLPIRTILKLNSHIQETNALTIFHKDWAKMCPLGCSHKSALPPGGHVFSLIMTIFELVRDIYKIDAKNVTSREINVLTKFHEYLTQNVTSRVENCPALWPPCFFTDLDQFHDDWAKIVTSRVFTRNTAPLPGGHVFQMTETIFELNQHIIKTNILTKLHEDWASNVTSTVFTWTNVLITFHEDRTINVASRVFTGQMLTSDGQQTKGDHKSSP
ncbi:hypothetical protein DPMN_073663 [Dreissena polymorpha]|uniref:Uncharacterized protein n=1 Tax=Dreissena polymorpha TaxID=45954 RepID=A0A9D4HDL9_DREPO|nr:hypothetical protein DPMN_073663 [Dreissena polymorpha]